MNNLSTPSNTDISSQIGALELSDHMEKNHSDGALEEAGMSMGDTTKVPTRPRPFGPCISDSALEVAGASVGNPTGLGCPTVYRCIGDSALEAAGAAIGPSPTIYAGCPTLICRPGAASIA
jgi:hypothetical protein